MARSLEADQAEYEEIAIAPTESEWLEQRRPWWNASLAGSLFGEHPWVSLGDACTEKLRADFEIYDEDRQKLFRRGLDMEPYVAMRVEELTGLALGEPGVMFRRGVVLTTLDRVGVPRGDGDLCGVELKTTRQYLTAVVPRYWWWQVQAQMWCADFERVVIGALDATLEVSLFEVWRDDDAIKRLVDRATDMMRSINWGEIPPGIELSAENVTAIWPRDTGEVADLPPAVLEHLEEYLEARKQEKQWRGVKEARRDRVAQLLGSAGTAAVNGREVATYKTSKDREKIDWRRMIDENPDLAAQYTTTEAGPRMFRVKEKDAVAMINELGGALSGSNDEW